MSKLIGFGRAVCKISGGAGQSKFLATTASGAVQRRWGSSTSTTSETFPPEGDNSNEPWIPPYVPVSSRDCNFKLYVK